MLDSGQVNTVVREALAQIGDTSAAGHRVVVLTGVVESNWEHTEQQGGGSALGYCQMEPFTHDDHWTTFLPGRPELAQKLLDMIEGGTYEPGMVPRANWLQAYPLYSAAMCRVHYLRNPDPLPGANRLRAQLEYWKRWYNTPEGAGTVEEAETRAMAWLWRYALR